MSAVWGRVDLLLAALSAAGWLYLLLFRGGFWRIDHPVAGAPPETWPPVVAVVPARNEAPLIGEAVRSLLTQDYPGQLLVVVADDDSRDGTAEAARAAACSLDQADRLVVLPTPSPPPGWTGKIWAQAHAIGWAARTHPDTELWLLTDADIRHAPPALKTMASRLLAAELDMASLMVRLPVGTLVEKVMMPAFVFFFRLLYPFRQVNNPHHTTAAAAGGYILIRRSALARIGGLAAIKGALIDDCALARLVKRRGGRIWLGLARHSVSLRRYRGLAGVWAMVTRSAYAQLRNSPTLLALTLAAMVLGFLVPPILTLAGGPAMGPAALAWAMMVLACGPLLRFYGLSPAWGVLLPIVALVYMAAAVDSARRHYQGCGGMWKGRVQGGMGSTSASAPGPDGRGAE